MSKIEEYKSPYTAFEERAIGSARVKYPNMSLEELPLYKRAYIEGATELLEELAERLTEMQGEYITLDLINDLVLYYK